MDAREAAAMAGQQREAALAILASATDDAKEAARAGAAWGITETELAQLLKVNRLTVRSWLGKDRRAG